MRIEPLVPDQNSSASIGPAVAPAGVAGGFGRLVEAAGAALAKADTAESAFARGTGGLQEMVVERARADISLAVASAAAQRAAQALNTLLGMQI